MTIALTPTEQGAGLGILAGGLLGMAFHKRLSRTEIIAIAALGGVAGAIVGQQMAGAVPSLAGAQSPLALVMAPGEFQESPTIGQTITMTLPAGGSWTSVTSTPQDGGPTVTPEQLQNGTAISWVYSSPLTAAIVWIDSTGTTQTTTLDFGQVNASTSTTTNVTG